MEKFFGTKEVSKILGVKVCTLSAAIWQERFAVPNKVGGRYLFSVEDVNKASKCLLGRPYKPETTDD
ncbi:MAG: helix-turn-helix domain-containing protein [Planctomycetota bacterium]|jgi:hypothetical protein